MFSFIFSLPKVSFLIPTTNAVCPMIRSCPSPPTVLPPCACQFAGGQKRSYQTSFINPLNNNNNNNNISNSSYNSNNNRISNKAKVEKRKTCIVCCLRVHILVAVIDIYKHSISCLFRTHAAYTCISATLP